MDELRVLPAGTPRRQSTGQMFGQAFSNVGQGIGQLAGQGIPAYYQRKQQAEALRQMGIPENLPPELQKTLLAEKLKGESKENLFHKKAELLGLSQGGSQQGEPQQEKGNLNQGQKQQQKVSKEIQPQMSVADIPDDYIAKTSLIDPNYARSLQHAKDVALRERREEQKMSREDEAIKEKKFESERKFHTGYSKKSVEEADTLRETLPKLEMSLDMARNAVESGDVGALSLANIGKRLGIPELQTAKGAQLVTAAKENLLGNMSRVSSRAQNQWFEQKLNSMMAQIGQSQEANLSAQEMLEAEATMSEAYLNEFDRISEDDMKNFGYERKDIAKRARTAVKPLENHIFNRTSFRMKELEEQEKGLSKLKNEVGKNVPKGTPFTPTMAKLYEKKFGDKSLEMAEKNGYRVPTLDEFKSFQERPREFREEFSE